MNESHWIFLDVWDRHKPHITGCWVLFRPCSPDPWAGPWGKRFVVCTANQPGNQPGNPRNFGGKAWKYMEIPYQSLSLQINGSCHRLFIDNPRGIKQFKEWLLLLLLLLLLFSFWSSYATLQSVRSIPAPWGQSRCSWHEDGLDQPKLMGYLDQIGMFRVCKYL